MQTYNQLHLRFYLQHLHQTAMVPSIGLAKGQMVAALYDCRSNVLLVLHLAREWFSTGRKELNVGVSLIRQIFRYAYARCVWAQLLS